MSAPPTTRQSAARPRRVHTLFSVGLAMADQDAHEEQPRRSSSIEKKRPSGDDEKGDKKRRKGVPSIQACSLRDSPVPADGDVGCSGLGNKSSECGTASNDKLDKLTSLLSGLIEKLDNNVQGPSTSDAPYYGGFHDLSSSDEDCVVAEGVTYDTDPLDNLDTICPAQPSLQTDVDDASFLRALDELSDCFHGDEPKGDPLSDRLASILNVSLRRRPNSDTVKTTCSRLKVPNNVPNMKARNEEASPLSLQEFLLIKAFFRTKAALGEKDSKQISPVIQPHNALDAALQGFLNKKIVERCEAGVSPGFFSNVFPTFKKDGSARVILNLKELNNYVKYSHFKMDSIKDVIQLVHPSSYFVTVDFKDAYYSVHVKPKDRKWLRFSWHNETFQFTCLPQGLSSAPRIFTKLLKPVLSHLRKLGITVCCNIDDCIFIADSDKELIDNVRYAVQLFDLVGLTVNLNKSVLVPTQEIEFLGITLNSLNMTATLPSRRRNNIKEQGSLLLKGGTSLHALAVFTGLTVASEPAVTLAPLRYKYLEIVRNKELVKNKGNYSAIINLDDHAKDLISWWIHKIDLQSKSLLYSPPQLELKTDACLTGWGAICGDAKTGGQWAQDELDHINCLELKAILLGLKSLCKNYSQTEISIRSDNTTAVACLVRGGSTKINLNQIIEEIFDWALARGITLSAKYIKGLDNVEADKESRIKNLDTEWMLKPHIFKLLCDRFYTPDIDLFASRLNAQVPTYVSWKPDPIAAYTNAFTISWNNKNGSLYAFPPFSIIGKMLKKIREDEASVISILPLWPTQSWFPLALKLLVESPVLLPREPLVLPQDPNFTHPQAPKLRMTSMILSGNPLKTKDFRRMLPNFSLGLGDTVQNCNMGLISGSGCRFVSAGKVIHFCHL
ncbi:hypothetical protein Pcinc_014187 [Petrolisthes cinctipes]|uniref:Reverse transcriptase domain-containing protein n=1 Tax=Petrolisthes cinctipes TaxID=88211 RepID=A0AAE1FVV3_PETCI|nr:hypothetical protein Pcinc_014187 [Petrolisthes cinctipes]